MPRAKLFREEEVLEKAMELFWKKGYHATSIQDLVDHLGINRASLYGTFEGKQALFDRAFSHYLKINTARVKEFLEQQPEVRAGFRKLFEAAIRESVEDTDRKGCFVVNTTTELVPGDAPILQKLEENAATFEGVFYDYLCRGQKQGDIPPGKDLRAIASLLFTLYNGIKVIAKVRTDPRQLRGSIEAALALLG